SHLRFNPSTTSFNWGSLADVPVNPELPPNRAATVIGTVNANLRTGPGEGYTVIDHLQPGTAVVAIGRNESAGWILVDLNGVAFGWMAAALLDIQGNVTLLPVTDNYSAAATVIGTSRANMRVGPSEQSAIIERLQPGTVVTAYGRNGSGEWIIVDVNATGSDGWINAALLDVDGNVLLLPVMDD
ncbi:MAG: SH3 domain-containing protein, partial [Anaerolineae bacterium]|nr:SH3 domain-containing protein [Anaerolineae bacterium]